ncbi:hypothetical protein CEXT_58151 [Caerostris extrusa]|uniref:Uncharacterized protein n=1 Tax=Caerostris extrusa TaxID=172846 RepID=A0AAV4MT32_CAEEX|nr:hypothetical protein CEXT_58151 [Caerostris extrusa]
MGKFEESGPRGLGGGPIVCCDGSGGKQREGGGFSGLMTLWTRHASNNNQSVGHLLFGSNCKTLRRILNSIGGDISEGLVNSLHLLKCTQNHVRQWKIEEKPTGLRSIEGQQDQEDRRMSNGFRKSTGSKKVERIEEKSVGLRCIDRQDYEVSRKSRQDQVNIERTYRTDLGRLQDQGGSRKGRQDQEGKRKSGQD